MNKRATEELYERCRETPTRDLWQLLMGVEPVGPTEVPLRVGPAALEGKDVRYVLATGLTLKGELATAAFSMSGATYIRIRIEEPCPWFSSDRAVFRECDLYAAKFEDDDNIANSLFINTKVDVAKGSRYWFDYGCWFHDCEFTRPPPLQAHCLFTSGPQAPDTPVDSSQVSGLLGQHIGTPIWSAAVRWCQRSGITVSGIVNVGVQDLIDELKHDYSAMQACGRGLHSSTHSVVSLPNGSLYYSKYPTTGIIIREDVGARIWFGVPHVLRALDLAGYPTSLRRLSLWPE